MNERTAGDLAKDVLQCLQDQRIDDLSALFSDDCVWEIAYELENVKGDQLLVRGKERFHRFQSRMAALIERTRFYDITISESKDPGLAFAECRSEVTTTLGQAYANRYVCKVTAENGRIRHWLEFYDPRPAEMIAQNMANARTANA